MIAAIVAAAGRSERMGRPKLLLPIECEPLIGRVVRALSEGGADRVVVVAPPVESEEGPAVAAAAARAGAEVVAPRVRPAEMRDSIEIGLATLELPAPPDHVLLAPGDAAGMTPAVVALLIEESGHHPEKIVVPRCGPRRGHPLVLPWNVATLVRSLPKGQGVNAILARHQALVVELPVADSRGADDIDTPDDFRQWDRQSQDDVAAADRRIRGQDEPAESARACRVQVRFFALVRERAGCSEIDLELAVDSRVSDLRAEIGRRLPGLAPLMKNVMIALDEEYADDETQIAPGARVAVIPPVSGGAGGADRAVRVEASRRGLHRP